MRIKSPPRRRPSISPIPGATQGRAASTAHTPGAIHFQDTDQDTDQDTAPNHGQDLDQDQKLTPKSASWTGFFSRTRLRLAIPFAVLAVCGLEVRTGTGNVYRSPMHSETLSSVAYHAVEIAGNLWTTYGDDYARSGIRFAHGLVHRETGSALLSTLKDVSESLFLGATYSAEGPIPAKPSTSSHQITVKATLEQCNIAQLGCRSRAGCRPFHEIGVIRHAFWRTVGIFSKTCACKGSPLKKVAG